MQQQWDGVLYDGQVNKTMQYVGLHGKLTGSKVRALTLTTEYAGVAE